MALTVFIGSSNEAKEKELPQQLAEALSQKGFTPIRWWDEFRGGDVTIERLRELAEDVDAAVFVWDRDDSIWQRGHAGETTRDNCILECGLFMSRLGLKRTGILAADGINIPSDLKGVTLEFYRAGTFRTAAERVAGNLKRVAPAQRPEIVPIVTDPGITQIAIAQTKIPAGWYSRSLYLRDEGASNWLAIADDKQYLLSRYGDKLGVGKLWAEAVKKCNATTIVSLGPGDGKPDREIIPHLLEREQNLKWIPVDISNGLIHYVVNRMKKDVIVPVGIVGDFEEGQAFIRENLEEYARAPMLVVLLGATFGNLDGSPRLFLTEFRGRIGENDFLLLDIPLAGRDWSFESDPRANRDSWDDSFRRFLACGLATHLGVPTQQILAEFDRRFGTQPEEDADTPEGTQIFRVYDVDSDRSVLRFRRFRWEGFLEWIKGLGFKVLYSARTAAGVDGRDVVGVGVVLVTKEIAVA